MRQADSASTWYRHNRAAYSNKSQVVLGWCTTIVGLGTLLACLVTVAYYSAQMILSEGFEDTVRRALGMSLGYAGLCSIGQVMMGLLLALCAHIFLRSWARRAVTTLMIIVYCLQPFVVEDIWARVLGFDTTSFAVLVAASIWQFSPFAMLFFQVEMDEVEREESWLASVESPSRFHRWRQVHLLSILKLGGVLVVLRFLWMYTKFDLPFLFQLGGHSSNYLVAVRIGKIAQGFDDACVWGGYMLAPLLLLFAIGLVLRRRIVRHPISAMERLLQLSPISRQWPRGGREVRVQNVGRVRASSVRFWAAVAVLALYLAPLIGACAKYLPRFHVSSVRVLGESLVNTFVVGGLAALVASILGAFLAYLSQRGHRSIDWAWRKSPALIYAVPLVLLSVFLVKAVPWLGEGARALSVVWYVPLRSILGITPTKLAAVNLYLANGTSAFLAFLLFSLPFTFFVLRSFCSNPQHLYREQLALVDGMKPGASFYGRVVIPNLGSAVLYSLFLSFIINWQDNSVPLRLQSSGFSLFSYELKKLASSEILVQAELVAVGLVFSIGLGTLFFFIYPRLERLIHGSQ